MQSKKSLKQIMRESTFKPSVKTSVFRQTSAPRSKVSKGSFSLKTEPDQPKQPIVSNPALLQTQTLPDQPSILCP